MDPCKNLFYCYGCGRGGDLIRFVELYHDVRFGEAMALLRRSSDMGSLLKDTARFYQMQLHRHPEAVIYLQQRGIQRARNHRRVGNRVCPGPLSAPLADDSGLRTRRSPASWLSELRRL